MHTSNNVSILIDWVDWFIGVDKVKNKTGDWFFGVVNLKSDFDAGKLNGSACSKITPGDFLDDFNSTDYSVRSVIKVDVHIFRIKQQCGRIVVIFCNLKPSRFRNIIYYHILYYHLSKLG